MVAGGFVESRENFNDETKRERRERVSVAIKIFIDSCKLMVIGLL